MLDGGRMFERFTNSARHVVVLAQEEARRLQHNYIGTEHILLGLLGEPEGVACRALASFGVTLEGTRTEVTGMIGIGKAKPSGHIPFTPRAKKTLELALREALQLHHKFIGTEHVLLAVMREGEGIGAQILKQHSPDLMQIRMAVLDLVSATPLEATPSRRWLRRWSGGGEESESSQSAEMRTTPAADVSLTEAARLAGSQPVGSHHLLLAAIADPEAAAARALAALGVDLDQARAALRDADVAGTSDEQPDEAGRRQMLIKVTGEQVTIEATDPVIVSLGQTALAALGDRADAGGVIRGDLPDSASLSGVWQALHDSLTSIQRRATMAPPAPRAAGAAGAAEAAGVPGKKGRGASGTAAPDKPAGGAGH
jgi:ATP-dependent Clp protease ATP-binding subunit ClpA